MEIFGAILLGVLIALYIGGFIVVLVVQLRGLSGDFPGRVIWALITALLWPLSLIAFIIMAGSAR